MLPRNWLVVRVYLACTWSRQPVFTGTALRWLYEGIAAAEIVAAMDAMGICGRARCRVFEGVRCMVGVAAKHLNAT